MKGLVYIPRDIAREGKEYLTERGYGLRLGEPGVTEEQMMRDVVGCDAMLLRTVKATRRVLEAGDSLQIVARHGVGLDIIDVAAATELGIQVTNTPSSNAESVAEYVFCGLLAAARNLAPMSAAVREGNFFLRDRLKGRELFGKTLGLVGLGHIGLGVARIAALGFGMKVIAYRHNLRGKPLPDYIRLVEWEELFSAADVVSVHIPLRPENIGLIGEREFAWMKPEAYFVNTARGKVVQEAALLAALRDRRIAGAVLDVFASEPPAPDNPLFALDNVVPTPHIGGATYEAMTRSAVYAAMEIDRVLSGQEPQWPVNRPAAPRRKP